MVNGWVVTKGLGVYGANPRSALWWRPSAGQPKLPQDAVYQYTEVDRAGRKLLGANNYTREW